MRQYFRDYQEALGLTKKAIIEKIGQCADHCFRWVSTQWDLPTPETYAELDKLPLKYEFIRHEYEDLRREYADLRREYEDQRYTFNNQKTHNSVWNYETSGNEYHPTQKPLELIKNIIRHSSNEGDTVYDPFMGSGTTGVACVKTNRKFIGVEIEKKYFDIAIKRIKEAQMQPNLFQMTGGYQSEIITK